MDIFEAAKDGILLCKLINFAAPDTVDMRCVHFGRSQSLSVYQARLTVQRLTAPYVSAPRLPALSATLSLGIYYKRIFKT